MMSDLKILGNNMYDFFLYSSHPCFSLYEYSSFKYILIANSDNHMLKTIT